MPQIAEIAKWNEDPEFSEQPYEQKQKILENFFNRHLSDESFLNLPQEDQDQIKTNFYAEHIGPSTASPSAPTEAPLPPAPSATLGGVVTSLGEGLARGLTTELPGMVGGMMEFTGSRLKGSPLRDPYMRVPWNLVEDIGHNLKEWSEEKAKQWYGPEKKRQGVERIVYEGSKMLAPSVVPAGTIGTGIRVLKGIGTLVKAGKEAQLAGDIVKAEQFFAAANKAAKSANTVASASVATMFGLSQAQNTVDNANQRANELEAHGKHKEAEEIRAKGQEWEPLATGVIEATGEFFGTKYLGKLFRLDETGVTKRGAVNLVKDFLKTLGVEVGTEIGQQYGQALVEKASGIRPEADPLAEAIDVIGPTAFMTLLTGGLAGAVNRMRDPSEPVDLMKEEEPELDLTEPIKKALEEVKLEEAKPRKPRPDTAREAAEVFFGEDAVLNEDAAESLRRRGLFVPEDVPEKSAEESARVINASQNATEMLGRLYKAYPQLGAQQRQEEPPAHPAEGTVPEEGMTPAETPVEPSRPVLGERQEPESEIERIDVAANEAATSPLNDKPYPSEGQVKAGNWKKGHVKVQGLDITIENPTGSERSGTDKSGKPWSVIMPNPYGYFKRTEGKDGDQIDVIIGPNPESDKAFIVDQIDPETGKFDEHKTLVGFENEEEASQGYLENYEPDWKGLGAITEMPMDEFKEWVKGGRKTAPVTYKKTRGGLVPPGQEEPLETAETPAQETAEEQGAAGIAAGAIDPEEYEFPEAVSPYDINRIWDDLYAEQEKVAERNEPKIKALKGELESIKGKKDKDSIARRKAINDSIADLRGEAQVIAVRSDVAFTAAQEKLARKILPKAQSEGLEIEEDDIFDAISYFQDGRMHEGGDTWTQPLEDQVIEYLREIDEEKTTSALLEEAKKYKTAEEFVEGQKLFHGTSKRAAKKISKEGFKLSKEHGGYSNTMEDYVSLTDDIRVAQNFADVSGRNVDKANGGEVIAIDKSKLKLADINKTYKEGEGFGEYIERMKKDGWDVIDATKDVTSGFIGEGEQEFILLNNRAELFSEKTKSQLTDIWNEAHKGEVAKEAKPKGPKEQERETPSSSKLTAPKPQAKKGQKQNLVTYLQSLGFINLGQYGDRSGTSWDRAHGKRSKNRAYEYGDIKAVARKNGKIPLDRAAIILNSEGWQSPDGSEWTPDTLFEVLADGKGRKVFAPELQDDKIELEIRREEDAWIARQLASLDEEAQSTLEAEVEREAEAETLEEIAGDQGLTDEELGPISDEASDFFQEIAAQRETATLEDIYAESKTGPLPKKPEKQLTPAGKERTEYDQVTLEGEAEPIFQKKDEVEHKPEHQTAMFTNILGQEVGNMEREGDTESLGEEKKKTRKSKYLEYVDVNGIQVRTPKDETARRKRIYTPGNIIWNSYWKNKDKILDYTEGENGEWEVTVQTVDENDNPIGDIRKHATHPARDTKIIKEALGGEQGESLTQPSQNLQDFGEKIGGARKDTARFSTKDISDAEMASKGISELWPKSEIDSIEDIPLAAFATTLRKEIPTKPQKSYAVSRWVEKVKMVKGLMSRAETDGVDAILQKMNDSEYRSLQTVIAKVKLLQNIDRDQWVRIGDVSEHPDSYRYAKEGLEKIPSPFVSIQIDGVRHSFKVKTVEETFNDVTTRLEGEAPTSQMKFEVRGRKGKWQVNKKGDPLYRPLKVFTGEDAKEAFNFITNNRDALVMAWEDLKARENVKETDVRRKENRPRVGKDYRDGKNATPEMFMDSFGFRGVEFGKWVSQGKNIKERQGMLNAAFDALHDLADILNVPSRAISLNGTLGLGLGSRGTGWASAHYEPDMLVINLTKTRGAGSLGHEFFHALDHYFQLKRTGGKMELAGRDAVFITNRPETHYQHERTGQTLSVKRFNEIKDRGGISKPEEWKTVEGVRPEVEEAFAELVKALDNSPMAKRSALIDKGRSGGYWSRIIERAARAFENYIIAKMEQKGFDNDYLANVTGIEEFSRDPGRYPYLLEDELAPVEKAFDNLFGTIQTKETEKGVAMLSVDRQAVRGEKLSTGDIALTPKTVKDLRGIARTVRDVFNQSLPEELLRRTSIELKPIIDLKGKNLRETTKQHGGKVDPSRVLGTATVNDLNAFIELSYNHDAGTIEQTAYHEMYHVARRWLLTDSELTTMQDTYENEEAEAEAFAAYAMDRKALPKETVIRRAFRRIRKVLRRIRRALQNKGFKTAEDVFDKLYEGGYKGTQLPTRPAQAGVQFRSYAPALYSQLLKTVNMKLGEMPAKAQSLVKWLERQNVKPEEMKWMGVEAWISENQKDGRIDKEAFRDFLEANRIELVEDVKKEKADPLSAEIDDIEVSGGKWINNEDREYPIKYILLNNGYSRPIDEYLEDKIQVYSEPIYSETDLDIYIAKSVEGGERYWVTSDNASTDLLDEEFGYSNLRELLVDRYGMDEELSDVGVVQKTKFSNWQLPGNSNYREMLVTLPVPERVAKVTTTGRPDGEVRVPDIGATFRSAHWDEPNVIAHVRMNDRTDAQGNKVLFLEEVQSDWLQQAKEKGFKVGVNDSEALRNEQDSLIRKKQRTADEDARLSLLTRQIIDAVHDKDRVPPAPFLNNWHEVMMKRMLRYAAENGYGKLSWTTGEQQAERYDLSKQVDSIGYQKRGDLYALTVWDKNGSSVYQNQSATKQEVEDTLGKEILRKMETNSGRQENGNYYLEGLDLKVGGEGMAVFYDEKLPNFMRKYVKQWGGKVGTAEIQTERLSDLADDIQEYETTAVHSVTLTPEMKQSVLFEGQTMFAIEGEGPGIYVHITREEADQIRDMGYDNLLTRVNIGDIAEQTGETGWLMLSPGSAVRQVRPYGKFSELRSKDKEKYVTYPKKIHDLFKKYAIERGAGRLGVLPGTEGVANQRTGRPTPGVREEAGYGENTFEEPTFFRVLEDYKPKKTRVGYKLFRTLKTQPGKLFPLFIGKSEPAPIGKWMEAEHIPTKGFAQRPGWHLGTVPRADHLLKKDGSMPDDRVWAEVEYPADKDWQREADKSSTRDIREQIPKDGFYEFKRPANQGGKWVIAGAIKINKTLNDQDVQRLNELAAPDEGGETMLSISGEREGILPAAQRASLKEAREYLKSSDAKRYQPSAQEGPLKESESQPGMLQGAWDEFLYQAQDRFRYLNKMQIEAERQSRRKLSEEEDAYLAETRYHGMAAAAIDTFEEEHVDPILKLMEEGDLNIEEVDHYLHARHAREANKRLQEINPELEDNDALSGMSDLDATRILTETRTGPKARIYQRIGEAVDAMTKARRDILVESGLERQDTIDNWERTYQYYVTLMREGKGGGMPRRGRGYDVRGGQKMRAGSRRDVVNILANVVAQHEATIVRAEKVKVGRAFLEFAKAHEGPWKIDTPEQVAVMTADGIVAYRANPLGYILADNVFSVRVDGKDHHITFDETNPHAMKIATALKNLDGADSGALVRVLSKVSRYLAMVNTALNPEFLVSNFARDIQTAVYNMADSEADAIRMKAIKEVGKAFSGIRDYQKGKRDTEWAGWFNRFRNAGGQTGWIQSYEDIREREKDLIKKVQKMKPGHIRTVKRGLEGVLDYVGDMNTAVENGIRLSTFKNLVEIGVSEARAAQIAKELTVNFNRRGNLGPILNTLYLFFNASIQGSARLILAGARSRKVRKLMAGTVVFATILDICNRLMGGDDDDGEPLYDKIPEWEKERNIILMLGKAGYISIPAPWGYNVFHVLGQAAGEILTKEDNKLTDSALKVAGAVVGAFNPMGGEASILQILSPTLVDPLVQWIENKDWSGRKIRPSSNPFAEKPKSQVYWSSVREPSRWIAEKLNRLTGGDEIRPGWADFSPEAFDMIIDTFTGGAGKFVSNLISTPIKAIKGDDIETYEVPFLRRLYGKPGNQALTQEYYENMDDMRLLQRQIIHYKNDKEKVKEIIAESGPKMQLIRRYRLTARTMKKYREEKKEIENIKNPERRKKAEEALDNKTEALMKSFNSHYNSRIKKGSER